MVMLLAMYCQCLHLVGARSATSCDNHFFIFKRFITMLVTGVLLLSESLLLPLLDFELSTPSLPHHVSILATGPLSATGAL